MRSQSTKPGSRGERSRTWRLPASNSRPRQPASMPNAAALAHACGEHATG
jgi:hypothetical protein